jgi:hypothetical protein
MDERRTEDRLKIGEAPENIKDVLLKYPGSKPIEAIIADVSSIGMAFVTKEKLSFNIDIGKTVHIRFCGWKYDIKCKIVYSNTIDESKSRIGVCFITSIEIGEFYNLCKAAGVKAPDFSDI